MTSINGRPNRLCCLVAALSIWSASRICSADYVIVYGGPTYSSNDGGYLYPFPPDPGAVLVNDSGTALGSLDRFTSPIDEFGYRAVRFNASGSEEFGTLGDNGGGYAYSQGLGINASGTTVGISERYDELGSSLGARAVRWNSPGTAATELDHLGLNSSGATQTLARAINGTGTIVGSAAKYNEFFDELGTRAVRWAAGGTAVTELGNLGTTTEGSTTAEAWAINSSGTAAGFAEKFDPFGSTLGSRAVRWNASGTSATELGDIGVSTLEGATDARAYAINSAGTAVGYALKWDGNTTAGTRAVRWDGSGTAATQLGDLGLYTDGTTTAQANDVNDAGTAIGTVHKYVAGNFKGTRGVRWAPTDTTAIELGNLGTDAGFTSTAASAINVDGIVVGYADKHDEEGASLGYRAVYWGTNDAAVDLNSLIDPGAGWLLYTAYSISNTGWITGVGLFDPDGAGGEDAYSRLFVLQLPEPADGDLDDNGVVDSRDIDTLWNVIRPEVAGSDDPGANDNEDLNGDGFVNEKDVDYMLKNLLTAGSNRQYGDADLDGGVGGLDYTAWRVRAGTGWANGDFDGDGGVGGLDYTLWRTRPTAYPTTVGPHGSELNAVPEPTTVVLLALALPALAFTKGFGKREFRS